MHQFSERKDWGKYFDKFDAKGTIVIVDYREDLRQAFVFNQERANTRYSPASTFKLPHTLFALDFGVVADEFQVFPWDGVKRNLSSHNCDHNLRSAMRHSVIWVYDFFASKIGERKASEYLKKINYGNADPSTKAGSYWIDGELSINAFEQVSFLEQLYRNQLPFKREHQRLVKDIMIVEAEKDWILRAKTGWHGRHGWWVGWLECSSGPIFFALNIDTPNRWGDLHKREAIVRAILQSIQALPNT